MKRPIFLFLPMIFLILAGCTALLPTVQPVTITFSCPAPDQAYYESLLPEFKNNHPNITINILPFTENPSQEADVMILPWMYTIGLDESRLSALPLDAYLSKEKDFTSDAFYPGALEAFRLSGKQIAIPTGIDPWVMYFNKNLFDTYGVPYPQPGWTWSDFLAYAEALRDPQEKTWGYTHESAQYIDAMIFVYQHGGTLVDTSGKPTFTDPLTMEAIQWYVDLFREFEVAPTRSQALSDFGATGAPALRGISMGKIGMFMMALSARGGKGYFPTEWSFPWGVIEPPRDSSSFTLAFFEGAAISKDSANPDAAWEWIAFISRKPHNRLVPARVALAESLAYAHLVGEDIARVGRTAVNSAMFVSGKTVTDMSQSIDLFFETVDALVNRDLNVSEELQKAQQRAESR
ncbi:ABC-type sugar transport system, periplasmic component [Anaerolinea thermolimosa]|uniref:ABC transporter substrate-binding protein n=1 Tax=Anaerolinea thermolimosa TaxID=229919 RepID=UPI0007829A8E|nr:extracellular solute-binding protein [Anaerolinea thermolimosa]GAP06919.1 ABC-type sugar transport system, periplasmic component [Anaerolinea thermolimosa]